MKDLRYDSYSYAIISKYHHSAGSRKLPDKDKKMKKHAKEDGWIWTTVLAVGADRPDEDATLYEEKSCLF